MRDDRTHAARLGHADRLERLGERAYLVQLDEDRVGSAGLDAAGQTLGVRHEQVVAHDLDAAAEPLGHLRPTGPVVLGVSVLDRNDRVLVDQLLVEVDHLLARARLALGGEDVLAVLVEFGRGRVESNEHVVSGYVPGLVDGLNDDGDGLFVGLQVRGESSLVADSDRVPLGLQHFLERVEDLRAHADRVGEAVGAGWDDHELLYVDVVVGVLAPVDDVHEGNGEESGSHSADVPVERNVERVGGGLCACQRDAQDRVGAQAALVLGTVEGDQKLVYDRLVVCLEPDDLGSDDLVDVADGVQDALAAVSAFVAVTKLDGLVGARRGARRHGRPPHDPRVEDDVDLYGRVAAGVQYLAGECVCDREHVLSVTGGSEGHTAPHDAIRCMVESGREGCQAKMPHKCFVAGMFRHERAWLRNPVMCRRRPAPPRPDELLAGRRPARP